MNAPMVLSPDALARIDRAIAKYPPDQRQSAVMAALTIAQDEKGWLSVETMDFVAQYLGMPPIAVYEVASFYTMYDVKPVGTLQDRHLHQSALRTPGRQHRGGTSQEETRHRVQRDLRGRKIHAARRRMLRRVR